MKKIPLTQGKFALVDDKDFDRINQFKWFAHRRRGAFYAARNSSSDPHGKRKTIHLHQEIFRPTGGLEVDHKDGNGLNNVRRNLRLATHLQNTRASRRKKKSGTSKFRGVAWHKSSGLWQSRIGVNYKSIYLGLFETPEAAAQAYNVAAQEFFGEFAQINSI